MDSSSEEEVEFNINIDASNIQPYMFEPLASSGDEEEATLDVDAHRIGNIDWCKCGKCASMTTGTESVCCLEVHNTDRKMITDGASCITEESVFESVCINRDVIMTAMAVFLNDNGKIPEMPEHETLRYIAYRQWTAWVHGKLGKKYRLPIPSCAVKKVRAAFPSHTGHYKGFEYSRFPIPE